MDAAPNRERGPVTANPDLPTAEDQENPLLAPDDPRTAPGLLAKEQIDGLSAGGPEYADDELMPGDEGVMETRCPLCCKTVEARYYVTEPVECPGHPGDLHPQIWLRVEDLEAHEAVCPMYRLLDAIFPDVHQDDDTPESTPS